VTDAYARPAPPERSTGARALAALTSPTAALVAILVAAAALRLLWLDAPVHVYADEKFYVNAARSILGWQVEPYVFAVVRPGIDPNTEHPAFGKLLIAASMLVLGDGPLGWRMPSVVAGLVSLVAVIGIVRSLGGSTWTAVVAATILALDVLTFVHVRIAMLDPVLVAFMLAGAWLALRRRWILAGIVLAVATLVKVSGILGLVAVVAWGLWSAARRGGKAGVRETVGPLSILIVAYAAVAFGGLWLLDLRFTEFANPLDHLAWMMGFGMAVTPEIATAPHTSLPWVWLVGGGQIDYYNYLVLRAVFGGSFPPLIVHAAVNPVLIVTAPIVVVLGLYHLRRPDGDPERWSLLWMAATYVPWVIIGLVSSRPMYLHYVLPVVPALAIATAAMLRRLPTAVTWVYLAACLVGFAYYFPFKGVP
jgi:predicted membrane-bound dolichyl-phosphate-mannose-protein mannosyltransferase